MIYRLIGGAYFSLYFGTNDEIKNNLNQISMKEISVNINEASIRPQTQKNIDALEGYNIVLIEHLTDEIQEQKKFEPECPKEFAAGMFEVTFQKGQDKKKVALQTEAKVGHMSSVIPGTTVVDGYIYFYNSCDIENIPSSGGEVLNKAEEEYFIKMLYKKFNKKMTDIDAKKINTVKDCALAIFFNGKNGIDEFHNNQKELLK